MNNLIFAFALVLLLGSKRAMEYFIVLVLCYLYPPVALLAGVYAVYRIYTHYKDKD